MNHPLLYNTVETDNIYLINVQLQALQLIQLQKMLQRSQQQPQQQQRQQQSYQVEPRDCHSKSISR